MSSPFLRMESSDPVDMVTDGALEVLRVVGVRGLTVSAVARWTGTTPSALSQRLSGLMLDDSGGPLDRMLDLVTGRFALRWLQWAAYPEPNEAVRLPVTAEERFGVRAWHALHDLPVHAGRGTADRCTRALAEARTHEATALARRLGVAVAEVGPAMDLLAGARWRIAVEGAVPDADTISRLVRGLTTVRPN